MCDQKPVFILLIAAFVPAFTMRDTLAADRTPGEPLENVTPFRLPDRITTQDGKTYERVILDKVEADGLLVLFSPTEGGSTAPPSSGECCSRTVSSSSPRSSRSC